MVKKETTTEPAKKRTRTPRTTETILRKLCETAIADGFTDVERDLLHKLVQVDEIFMAKNKPEVNVGPHL